MNVCCLIDELSVKFLNISLIVIIAVNLKSCLECLNIDLLFGGDVQLEKHLFNDVLQVFVKQLFECHQRCVKCKLVIF